MMPVYSVAMLIFLAFNCAYGALNFSIESNEENAVNSCVLKVIKQLVKSKSTVDLTLMNVENSLAVALNRAEGVKFIMRTFSWNHIVYNYAYLVVAKDYEELQSGIKIARKDVFWYPKQEFIIVIEDFNKLEEVSILLHTLNIYNVTVIGKYDNEYSVYGFHPDIDACNRPALRTLESISKCSEFENQKIFRFVKVKTMRDCRLTLLTRNYWPYSLIHEYILKEWVKANNVTADLIKYEELKNATYLTMLEMVGDHKVTGTIGFAFSIERASPLDFSYPYQITRYRLIVPRARILTLTEAINKQLTLYSHFLSFILFLIFYLAAKYLLIFGKKKGDCLREMIIVGGYFLQNITMREKNKGLTSRFFLMLLILFTTLYNYIFVAYVSSAVTSPIRDHQVDEINDMHSRYGPLTNKEFFREIFAVYSSDNVNGPEKVNVEKLTSGSCYSHLDCLKRVKDSKENLKFTIISSLNFDFNIWKLDNKCSSESSLHRFSEALTFIFDIQLFQPGSTVTAHFNKHIHRMLQGGITQKIYRDLVFQEKLKSECVIAGKRATPESLSELQNLFVLYLVSNLASSICLVTEILFTKFWNRYRINI